MLIGSLPLSKSVSPNELKEIATEKLERMQEHFHEFTADRLCVIFQNYGSISAQLFGSTFQFKSTKMKNVSIVLQIVHPIWNKEIPAFFLMIRMDIRGVERQPTGTFRDLVNNRIFPGQRLPGQITANTPHPSNTLVSSILLTGR